MRTPHFIETGQRLRAGSRKNATCTAFRGVGRVIRTVQLLRYLSDAPLRRRVTAATDKVEASTASPSGSASATAASSPTTTPSSRASFQLPR
ncbi:transposase [Streptomyces werraensis]|uniref:transposase n=1 Tax=Streptomyces werraensis TaxID=68284 RepID=UPI001CE2B4CF